MGRPEHEGDNNNFFFQSFFTLGRGILRPLNTIYKCATRIYDESNYVGKLVSSLVNSLSSLYGRMACSVGLLRGSYSIVEPCLLSSQPDIWQPQNLPFTLEHVKEIFK